MSDNEQNLKSAGESTITFVKTKKAYVRTEKVTVAKVPEPPRRTEVKEPLTAEHRKELNELITEWVVTSNLVKKPLEYAGAWKKLFKQGLDGKVNKLNQIEQSEFDKAKKYIKQQIKIIESTDKGGLTRLKSDYRNRLISGIHAKSKKPWNYTRSAKRLPDRKMG